MSQCKQEASSGQGKFRLTHADLAQFTGDLVRYVHPLNRQVIYTNGVRYLANEGRAYWLIDAIASYFGSELMNAAIGKDSRLRTDSSVDGVLPA